MENLKFIYLLVLLISSNILYAATATPTSYKTTVSKFELCSSSDCSDPVVLGSTSKQFDIASKSAGSDVGTYLNNFTIELGRTYTHARSTVNSTFQVQGTVDVSGTICNTVASPSNTAASATATAKTAAGGTLADMAWIVPNANGGGDYSDLRSTFTANGIAKTDGASTFTFTVALAVPYTPKATDSPKILIKFDVADTLIATLGGGLCVIYVDPPVQTVTIMK